MLDILVNAHHSTESRKPNFGTTIAYRQFTPVTPGQLYDALAMLAPNSRMGDWTAPFKARPTDDAGTDMLSVDGVPLTMINLDVPLPPKFFEQGRVPNYLIPNANAISEGCHAHATIMPASTPNSPWEACQLSRAVTLLGWACAHVVKANIFKWHAPNNLVPINVLKLYADRLLPFNGDAIPAWVRILAGRVSGQSSDRPLIIAGTYGLWTFGRFDVEYAPTNLPMDYLIPHAYSVSKYLMRNSIKDGDELAFDDVAKFRVGRKTKGFFHEDPVLMLTQT